MIKKSTAIKFLVLVILTGITIFVLKVNDNFKMYFYKNVYDNNISFAKINNWYQTKFGSPLPFSKYFEENIPVFNEKLKYNEANIYKDGVNLSVESNYLVPALESGIVVFVGDKEGYGKTVIIEQANGVTVWYSNLKEVNIKIYDYVNKGSLIGEVDNNLYLVFYKDGKQVDYKEYI